MLDKADRRILRAIQQEPDLTMRELGERTGLSHTPCWRRMQKLQDSGVISGRRYLLDPTTLGYELTVFCSIRMKEHSRQALNDFEAAVVTVPEVMQCYLVTGDHDYGLRVIARSVSHYEETIKNSLLELPNVALISTRLALKEIKNTTCIPV